MTEPRLCYAPPQQIPHPPHAWWAPKRDVTADELFAVEEWFCNGWAAVLPGWIEHLQKEAN